MNIYANMATSIGVLVAVVLTAVLLKRVGLIKEERGPLFSRLVTHATLPALIFHSLAHSTLEWQYGFLALIMFAAELISLTAAWMIGRRLELERPQLGTFMLVSGFGSSALLGYALIAQLFPGNADAMAESVIISELGVGPALFTLGVMIALYYGSGKSDPKERLKRAFGFFASPIFISVIFGIGWSVSGLPVQGLLIGPLFEGLKILGNANTFMVALTVGLLLQFSGLRSVLLLVLWAGLIKLVLQPVLVWLPTPMLELEAWQLQVLVLEAAMPSAMLSVVLAGTYGCDARLASKLVFATTVASAVTAVAMSGLLGV